MPTIRREVDLQLNHDATFVACRNAVQLLGWTPLADAAEGGLYAEIEANWRQLRPKLTMKIRLADSQSVTSVRASVEPPGWAPLGSPQAVEILESLIQVLRGEPPDSLIVGHGSLGRLTTRSVVMVLLAAAIISAVAISLPTKHVGDHTMDALPSVALGQAAIYRLEIGLVIFYGGLIVLTPVFYGVIRGRLPIEISTRGARFPEEVAENVDSSIRETQALTDELKHDLTDTQAKLVRARLNIDELARKTSISLSD